MASILVQNANLNHLRDIQDAIDQRLRICVHADSYSDLWLAEEYSILEPYIVRVDRMSLVPAMNEGRCDVSIHYKQQFESELIMEELNPSCTLSWEGRMVKPLRDGYVTRFDPGKKCTDLVNEVFNYYVKEMTDNGTLREIWKRYNTYHGTDGHCGVSTEYKEIYPDGSNEDSSDERSLTAKDMAGAMVFQVFGSFLAIGVSVAAAWRRRTSSGDNHRTTTRRTVRRLSETSRGLSNHQHHNGSFVGGGGVAASGGRAELRELSEQMARLTEMASGLTEMASTMQEKMEGLQAKMEANISNELYSGNTCTQYTSEVNRDNTDDDGKPGQKTTDEWIHFETTT